MNDISENLPKKICATCKEEKLLWVHFSQKSRYCRDCAKIAREKIKKKQIKTYRRDRWHGLYMPNKKPYEWELI